MKNNILFPVLTFLVLLPLVIMMATPILSHLDRISPTPYYFEIQPNRDAFDTLPIGFNGSYPCRTWSSQYGVLDYIDVSITASPDGFSIEQILVGISSSFDADDVGNFDDVVFFFDSTTTDTSMTTDSLFVLPYPVYFIDQPPAELAPLFAPCDPSKTGYAVISGIIPTDFISDALATNLGYPLALLFALYATATLIYIPLALLDLVICFIPLTIDRIRGKRNEE